MRKIDKKTISIVFIGKFNPAIFQPLWFSSEGLIRNSEGNEAKIELIHPDVTIFSLDWIKIEAFRNKIIFSSLQEEHDELIADLVINSLSLLRHTPLYQMGINVTVNFSTENDEEWNKIGDTLTPKSIWNKVVKKPGMKSIAIQSMRDDNNYKGFIQIRVSPHPKQKNGVVISINDHYEIDKSDNELINSEDIINIFKTEWKKSVKKSDEIVNYLKDTL